MNTRKTVRFLCTVLSLILVFSTVTLAVSATGEKSAKFSDLANWQGDLDPDTPITEVNTPGTHDSAMFGIGSGIFEGLGFAHNQDLTFEQQLNIGVRYIDGRFCYEDEENPDEMENIFCCHGGYIPEMDDEDISLKMMLAELNKFLDKHPTEYIFLPYKCESEEDMKSGELNALLGSIFAGLAAENSERYMVLYSGKKVPTVEEAKGHIIATPNSNSGIFPDKCCIANTYSSGTDEKVKELSDVFDINNIRKLTKDTRYFTCNYENKPKSDRSPRLIHTSCYQAPFRTPARTSSDIHEWILGKVEKLDGVVPPTFHKGYYYGIVLFDYVKEDECRLIVDLNNTEDEIEMPENAQGNTVPATATVLGDSGNVIAITVIAVVVAAIVAFVTVFTVKEKRRLTEVEPVTPEK